MEIHCTPSYSNDACNCFLSEIAYYSKLLRPIKSVDGEEEDIRIQICDHDHFLQRNRISPTESTTVASDNNLNDALVEMKILKNICQTDSTQITCRHTSSSSPVSAASRRTTPIKSRISGNGNFSILSANPSLYKLLSAVYRKHDAMQYL